MIHDSMKGKVYDMLGILAKELRISVTMDILRDLTNAVCQVLTYREFCASWQHLRLNYTGNRFPVIAHFYQNRHADGSTGQEEEKYQQWQIDASRKLGMHPSELPDKAKYLTEKQRNILGIMSPREITELVNNIKAMLSGRKIVRPVAMEVMP